MVSDHLSFICIVGRAYSGKDTAADYIVAQYNKHRERYAIKIALADLLKTVCRELIKMFYGINIPVAEFYDQEAKDRIRYDMPNFCGKPFTLRAVLQQVGTEIFRNYLWETIWCEYVEKLFVARSNYKIIVISDIRRQDELDYFAKFEHVTSICIKRDKAYIATSHDSEANIEQIKVKHEVANIGTIPELYAQLEEIIRKDADIEHTFIG